MNPSMKPKQIKILQEFRELHRPPGRSVSSKPDGLYLMRLRSRLTVRQPLQPRVFIPVYFKGAEETHAEAVKITHL